MLFQKGMVAGPSVTVVGGPWTRILISNLDTQQSFDYQINGNTALTLFPLSNYGDNYPDEPITRVDLVNTGGNPAYQLTLHA